MLDPDISSADARRLLSAPRIPTRDDVPGPRGWTRRTFLQALGAGVFGAASIGSIADEFFGGSIPAAWAGSPVGPADGITIVITIYGGIDGLNVFVPYGNGDYYSKRANIAISADKILAVDANVGFAPQLTYLKSMYDAGQVAAVQGIGYSNPDLSHFTSMGIWMTGALNNGFGGTGWIGRWLDGQPAATADLAAASLDSSVPLHMLGYNRRAVGIPPNGNTFGVDSGPSDIRMYNGLRGIAAGAGRGALHDMYTSTMTRELDLATQVGPSFKAALPSGGELTRKLTIAARLLNANIGLRFLDISRSGVDTHENENSALPGVLSDLNAGLQAFFAALNPAFLDRVTIMTVSEFGRTQASNASGGTDHGTTNTSFVIGSNVRGGLYGAMPSLSTVDRNGRMLPNVDFRSMYGSVLDGWMGGGGSTIINGAYQDLGLFKSSPGTPSSTPISVVLGPSAASGFVPISPLRMFDTRDGTGGRTGPLGEGETWTFQQVGQFGIPLDATAVAWNLTAVDADVNTYITVWPGGTQRPTSSSLNPVPGAATPNLVIGQLGGAGSVSMFNNAGTVHLVADLVGYFTSASTLRLQALTPARLLDTRDGTGGISGGIVAGKVVSLKVNGAAGVPAKAKAVVLNVLATGPTDPSYLTVWPGDKDQPLASSVNMVTGQTVPNMVITPVSADGRINIFNNAGASHVIIDVLGAFVDNAVGRFVALPPGRILDTRDGTGIGAPGPVGQTPLALTVTGAAGVPATGVSAVMMNVTVVQPTNETYVTVFPTGGAMPVASNLNAMPGQIVPNMVLGRLGPDGAVAFYNNAGTVDIVADVVGYFTA